MSALSDFSHTARAGNDITGIGITGNYQLEASMKDLKLYKSALAEKMGTSRLALDRLLDPANKSVTLETLKKAAHATGQRLEIRLVSKPADMFDG